MCMYLCYYHFCVPLQSVLTVCLNAKLAELMVSSRHVYLVPNAVIVSGTVWEEKMKWIIAAHVSQKVQSGWLGGVAYMKAE